MKLNDAISVESAFLKKKTIFFCQTVKLHIKTTFKIVSKYKKKLSNINMKNSKHFIGILYTKTE